jgi:hypothetical protein
MTPTQITYLTDALGYAPSDFQQKLFLRLALYLNRDPNPDECVNMSTDNTLIGWVLAGI